MAPALAPGAPPPPLTVGDVPKIVRTCPSGRPSPRPHDRLGPRTWRAGYDTPLAVRRADRASHERTSIGSSTPSPRTSSRGRWRAMSFGTWRDRTRRRDVAAKRAPISPPPDGRSARTTRDRGPAASLAAAGGRGEGGARSQGKQPAPIGGPLYPYTDRVDRRGGAERDRARRGCRRPAVCARRGPIRQIRASPCARARAPRTVSPPTTRTARAGSSRHPVRTARAQPEHARPGHDRPRGRSRRQSTSRRVGAEPATWRARERARVALSRPGPRRIDQRLHPQCGARPDRRSIPRRADAIAAAGLRRCRARRAQGPRPLAEGRRPLYSRRGRASPQSDGRRGAPLTAT